MPVNTLSAWSKLAGVPSAFANNVSKTDLELLPNSQKNIQDQVAYAALSLRQGKGWLPANLRSQAESEEELRGVERGSSGWQDARSACEELIDL